MATITGLTAERMLEIEASCIVNGAIDLTGHLILTTHGGDTIDAGSALAALPNRIGTLGQEVSDWNNATENGFYYSVSGALNTPVVDHMVGTVQNISNGALTGRIVQEVGLPTIGGVNIIRSWRRTFNSTTSTWSAWFEVTPVATATLPGIVELATPAEVITGTDTTRAVTIEGLVGRTSTDTRIGLVELATPAEVITGTDTTRAVTVAGLVGRTSTDTRIGLVELATNAEVSTGTDTARAVTPAGLASRAASPTLTGLVELATQAEVNTGTDAVRAVTPATLRGDANLPYAFAAGEVQFTHGASLASVTGVTITLPSGRFSQAPIATVNLSLSPSGSQKCVPRIYQSTTTALTAGVWQGDQTAANVSHTDGIQWMAVQMTSGAAAG